MLTGEVPIGRVKLPSERLPQLDPRVDALISRALEPDPNARYPRVATLASELEEILGGASDRPAGAPAASSRKTISSPRQLVATGGRGLRLALTGSGPRAPVAVLVSG